MMIHEITRGAGRYKNRKRLGRGIASGHGKTAGRGTKGAGSRSGWSGSINPAREGGQTPWFRRIPKRGFSNAVFRVEYAVVNLRAIAQRFEAGAQVTPELLVKAGLLRDTKKPVKILAEGDVAKKLNITAQAFSAAAKAKIEKAGGTATVAA